MIEDRTPDPRTPCRTTRSIAITPHPPHDHVRFSGRSSLGYRAPGLLRCWTSNLPLDSPSFAGVIRAMAPDKEASWRRLFPRGRSGQEERSPARPERASGATVPGEWAWVELNHRPHAYQAIPPRPWASVDVGLSLTAPRSRRLASLRVEQRRDCKVTPARATLASQRRSPGRSGGVGR